MKNRIQHWRERRNLSMQALADKIGSGTTASTINKLEKGPEKGGMKLTTIWMDRLAKALDVRPIDLLPSNPGGEVRADVKLYTPAPDDPLIALAKLPDHKLYEAATDVLVDFGINVGDRLLANTSLGMIGSIPPLAAVVAEYSEYSLRGEAKAAILILRQFVPPNKLIMNNAELFQPNLDLRSGWVKITGVVVMQPRDMRGASS